MKRAAKKSRAVKKKPARKSASAADVLLEIGVEELPAAYVPGLVEQLRENAARLFKANGLEFGVVEAHGAPRRLVLVVRGLGAEQVLPQEEVRGPSKAAAFDAEGKPTKALEGFLRSRGGSLKQIEIRDTGKGEYATLVIPPRRKPSAAIVPGLLEQVIASLKAPKTMRWNATGARFARPVRWIAAFAGARVLKVSYGGVRSGNRTYVGGPLRTRAVAVNSAASYLAALKRAGVVLDAAQRRQWIAAAVERVAKRFKGRLAPELIDFGLLDEVVFLTEAPRAVVGQFDRKYLLLPREVLLASMAKHQRVFAVEDGKGKLVPEFIGILEGDPGKPALVRSVCERILNARLEDSLLFWNQDRARPLESADLKGVAFHQQLGSMEDKSARLEALAAALAEAWAFSIEEGAQLARACRLAKRDLVSTLVKEFPTLQGVMGKHYALHAGETREVAQAIEEHYLPLGERAPRTVLGNAASVIDKWDTLCGYFGLGIEPTGDQDPYGLRRAALGIIDCVWRLKRPLPLRAFFDARAALPGAPFEGMDRAKREAVFARVSGYLIERLYNYGWPGTQAPGADVIDAVRATGGEDLLAVMRRMEALAASVGDPAVLQAAKVIERTGNILRGAGAVEGGVDTALLRQDEERGLHAAYERAGQGMAPLLERSRFGEATACFGKELLPPLDAFFEAVLVNAPEAELRRNRLALLKAIHALYTGRVADLSKLKILETEEKV